MPNRPIIKTGGQEAFYSPASDYIQIPDLKYFEKEQWYYSSLFHELVHSTKHPSRLGTNTIRKSGNTFGNKNYSMEELVAEMGAVFLCSHAGILYYTIENSAAYLKSWKAVLLKHLKEDKKFIFTASSEAQKAADYMLNISEVKNYNAAKIKALALEIELELVSLGEESSKFSEALKASNPFAIKRKLRFLKEHPEVVANPLSIFIGTQLGKVDESDLIVGRITKEVAKKALITEAIIYLESGIPGRNGFGLKHIKSEHQDILDYLGVSAIEFVKMICENFNEIREDKNGKIDLLVNANKQKLLVVALKEDEDRENYYRVITALICKRKEIIKRKLLYSKSPSFDNLSGISSALVKMLS